MLLAQMVTGKVDLADALFLIAAILFALVAILWAVLVKPIPVAHVLTAVALCLVAAAFWVT